MNALVGLNRCITNYRAGRVSRVGAVDNAVSQSTAGAEDPERRVDGSDCVVLDFIHLNDTHGVVEPIYDSRVGIDGPVGGLSRVKTVIDKERDKNPDGVLVLHAGDHAEGSMISYLSKGAVVRDATADWFDAVCPGNHDHAWGQKALYDFFSGLHAAKLCCNVVDRNGNLLKGFEPYHIFERKGVKIGVIGVNTPEVPHYVAAAKLKGLEFKDPVEAVASYLPELRRQGAEVIVVLSHTGLRQPGENQQSDIKMAHRLAEMRKKDPDLPKVDLIVGGHTHDRLFEGVEVDGTLIVQAGSLTEYVGKAELVFDSARRQVVSHNAVLIPVVASEVEPDPETEAILRPYLEQAHKIGSKVMGYACERLEHAHRKAAKLNQIHADSILKHTDAELVICNSRTLRADVPAGKVTYEQLYAALPFTEDTAVTMWATGKMIRAEIEECLKDGARELAIPAGLKYVYDPKRPEGSRVVSITLQNGKALEDEKWYRVGMNWTMSNQKRWNGAKDRKSWGSCQELFFKSFQEGGPWKNDPDDRIVELNS